MLVEIRDLLAAQPPHNVAVAALPAARPETAVEPVVVQVADTLDKREIVRAWLRESGMTELTESQSALAKRISVETGVKVSQSLVSRVLGGEPEFQHIRRETRNRAEKA